MDHTQITAFIDLMIGWTPIGVDSDGGEVAVRTSPQVVAFVTTRLGDLTPAYGLQAVHDPTKGAALAGLLREVAEGLAPDADPVRDALAAILSADEEQDGSAMIHALRDARKLLGDLYP